MSAIDLNLFLEIDTLYKIYSFAIIGLFLYMYMFVYSVFMWWNTVADDSDSIFKCLDLSAYTIVVSEGQV